MTKEQIDRRLKAIGIELDVLLREIVKNNYETVLIYAIATEPNDNGTFDFDCLCGSKNDHLIRMFDSWAAVNEDIEFVILEAANEIEDRLSDDI